MQTLCLRAVSKQFLSSVSLRWAACFSSEEPFPNTQHCPLRGQLLLRDWASIIWWWATVFCTTCFVNIYIYIYIVITIVLISLFSPSFYLNTQTLPFFPLILSPVSLGSGGSEQKAVWCLDACSVKRQKCVICYVTLLSCKPKTRTHVHCEWKKWNEECFLPCAEFSSNRRY